MNAIDTAYKAGMDHAASIESDGKPLHPVLGDSLAYMYGELIIPRKALWQRQMPMHRPLTLRGIK